MFSLKITSLYIQHQVIRYVIPLGSKKYWKSELSILEILILVNRILVNPKAVQKAPFCTYATKERKWEGQHGKEGIKYGAQYCHQNLLPLPTQPCPPSVVLENSTHDTSATNLLASIEAYGATAITLHKCLFATDVEPYDSSLGLALLASILASWDTCSRSAGQP